MNDYSYKTANIVAKIAGEYTALTIREKLKNRGKNKKKSFNKKLSLRFYKGLARNRDKERDLNSLKTWFSVMKKDRVKTFNLMLCYSVGDVLEESVGPRKYQVIVGLVIFVLWVALLPLVNRSDIKVFGIPLLWFYYVSLSIATTLALTIMYLAER